MIDDPDRLSILVRADETTVSAGVSVSLGLIVTELVINALKRAFPDQPTGQIVIDYHSSGNDWTLSVSDNGVGMPFGGDTPKAGLGTGIVEALAKNLMGTVTSVDANPGTIVTISHRENSDSQDVVSQT